MYGVFLRTAMINDRSLPAAMGCDVAYLSIDMLAHRIESTVASQSIIVQLAIAEEMLVATHGS